MQGSFLYPYLWSTKGCENPIHSSEGICYKGSVSGTLDANKLWYRYPCEWEWFRKCYWGNRKQYRFSQGWAWFSWCFHGQSVCASWTTFQYHWEYAQYRSSAFKSVGLYRKNGGRISVYTWISNLPCSCSYELSSKTGRTGDTSISWSLAVENKNRFWWTTSAGTPRRGWNFDIL